MNQTALPPKPPLPLDPKALQSLIERAQKGDRTALTPLQEFLDDPQLIEKLGGNLAYRAERSLIEAAGGDNLLFKEAVTRKLEQLRKELAGPNPTPMERLLVERVVTCWLQVQNADIREAQAKDLSIRWLEYYQRRMNYTHKRYLSALKTLALVLCPS